MIHQPGVERHSLDGGVEYFDPATGRASRASFGGASSEISALMGGTLTPIVDPLGIWGEPAPACLAWGPLDLLRGTR